MGEGHEQLTSTGAPRRVVVFYNPISGRGRSAAAAGELRAVLEARGVSTTVLETQPPNDGAEPVLQLDECDAVVIAGGDGTVMGLLDAIAAAEKPLYVLPTGNQSLFARSFKMSAAAEQVAAALMRAHYEQHYFGRINGNAFFHMVSVGLDSEVIDSISGSRSGPISNAKYILPAARCLLRHTAPRLSVLVDGVLQESEAQGYLIIANTAAYAGGLNPVPHASSKTPELSVRFIPKISRLRYAGWGIDFLLQRRISAKDAHDYSGCTIAVRIEQPESFPVQADGEAVGRGSFNVSLAAETLRVLVP